MKKYTMNFCHFSNRLYMHTKPKISLKSCVTPTFKFTECLKINKVSKYLNIILLKPIEIPLFLVLFLNGCSHFS
jgi:hypothetical protein